MYKLSNIFVEFINQKEIIENTPSYLIEISNNLFNCKSSFDDLSAILTKQNIANVQNIKHESLDFLLAYANFILKDGFISENELYDFTALKRIFNIKEGDFMKYKNFEIIEVLKKEFFKIYSDFYINKKEEIINYNLQSLFDLSYDEFEEIKKDDIINALLNGANPMDLDIAKIPVFENILPPSKK